MLYSQAASKQFLMVIKNFERKNFCVSDKTKLFGSKIFQLK